MPRIRRSQSGTLHLPGPRVTGSPRSGRRKGNNPANRRACAVRNGRDARRVPPILPDRRSASAVLQDGPESDAPRTKSDFFLIPSPVFPDATYKSAKERDARTNGPEIEIRNVGFRSSLAVQVIEADNADAGRSSSFGQEDRPRTILPGRWPRRNVVIRRSPRPRGKWPSRRSGRMSPDPRVRAWIDRGRPPGLGLGGPRRRSRPSRTPPRGETNRP